MPQGAPVTQTAAPAAGIVAAAAASGGDFGDLAPIVADPRQLVRGVAQASGWNLEESGDDWKITVTIGATRKQVVHVKFGQRDEGHELLAFSSICGPATDKNAMSLLRYNTKMVHGAFAVDKTEAGEMIVLRANQLADTADPLEVTRAITAIAWQADKVEGQLLGGNDQY
jgi:hypothetical protein